MTKVTALFAIIFVASSISACSVFKYEKVKAWQKGVLAKDEMQLRGGDEMEIYVDDHIYFSKEGSTGGYGIGAGGCGCN